MRELIYTLLLLTAVLLMRFFVMEFVWVKGSSMKPTLSNGDFLLVLRSGILYRSPRRYDVVICRYPNRTKKLPILGIKFPEHFVKRVIGMPGETIAIEDGRVVINGEMLTDDVFKDAMRRKTMPPRKLGEDEFFVMGDNRNGSMDSRTVGPIRKNAICGHAVRILLPPGHFIKLP